MAVYSIYEKIKKKVSCRGFKFVERRNTLMDSHSDHTYLRMLGYFPVMSSAYMTLWDSYKSHCTDKRNVYPKIYIIPFWLTITDQSAHV